MMTCAAGELETVEIEIHGAESTSYVSLPIRREAAGKVIRQRVG